VSTVGVVIGQPIVGPAGELIVQLIEPAGVCPTLPVTRTVRIVEPPSVVAVFVTALIVGLFCEIPTLTTFETFSR
jgi:hypothetical protein